VHRIPRPRVTRRAALAIVPLAALAAACGSSDGGGAGSDTPSTEADGSALTVGPVTEEATLRLGYFPNVTHAPAIVGVEDGIFAESLGDEVTVETSLYNAGPEAVEALLGDALDVSYIGPNPAINLYAQTGGEAIRIVSGSTSGGAFFVVAPDIDGPEDLEGATVASPQLGGTQDVALRVWLKDNGLETDTTGGGDVSIVPQSNADTLTAFKAGEIDGAWVPEPWATRLVQEGGGKVLVDEADLWPEGRYVTTHIIVRTPYLEEHPEVVKALLEGNLAAIERITADPEGAQTVVNDAIEEYTGNRIPDAVIAAAFGNLEFTVDPIASSLKTSADDAEAVGLLEPVDLDGIYDLAILNQVLEAEGRDPVEGQ